MAVQEINRTESESRDVTWYMPGSVLNALWGHIMPRLAASVWLGEVAWFPEENGDQREDTSYPRLHVVEGKELENFANQVVKVAFRRKLNEDFKKVTLKSYKDAAAGRNNGHRLTTGQWCALVSTEYFFPGVAADHLENRPPADRQMRLRIVEAEGYDFVLSDQGLDVFVPPKPGAEGFEGSAKVTPEEARAAQEEVLKLYKFRETSRRPIGLPKGPRTAFPRGKGAPALGPRGDSFINIPQMSAPTGSHQVPEGWVRGEAKNTRWWLSGALYRGIMEAFPRIVASKWYEEVAWTDCGTETKDLHHSYRMRFDDGVGMKDLLEERTETVLPSEMRIFRSRPPGVAEGAKGWNSNDIMITSEGIYFPDPGDAPDWETLARAIQSGVAGNPVFTDSVPPCK